jgi:hypothetical protein
MAISISGTTLTFNDATTQTTARTSSNTVTSIVAGTGISISGATGAVTITNTVSGGVSSINGQTGAVVTTDAGGIGAVGIFMNAGNADVAYSSTIAGSNLRYDYSTSGSYLSVPGFGSSTNGRWGRQNNSSYPGGGSSLSGTWRKLGTGSVFATEASCCGTVYYWITALYVRVS